MGKLRGILPIDGTVGNITFAKTRDGIVVREKGGISADRIASDPAFQRTRENNAEFGRAGKATRLFRNVFRSVIKGGRDPRLTSRLMKEMMFVLHQDLINPRGLRTVTAGDLSHLSGFEFNSNGKLSTAFILETGSNIDRVTGALTVTLASYVPQDTVLYPEGATHYRLTAAGAGLDFDQNIYEIAQQATAYIAIDNVATTAATLICNLTANSTLPLFLVLGIEFFQDVNGQKYPLKNGAHNAMAVMAVNA